MREGNVPPQRRPCEGRDPVSCVELPDSLDPFKNQFRAWKPAKALIVE